MRVIRGIPARADGGVALTIGNFDGVHLGHRAMLARLEAQARGLGLVPCVMTFEPHPREFFAPDQAPTRLASLREKIEVLGSLGVERVYVCRFDYDFARIAPEAFVERYLVDGVGVKWLLVGDDFRFGARRAGDFALLDTLGKRHDYVVESMSSVVVNGVRVSSTAVREALAEGRLDDAACLLGRPYSISGRVVKGDQLGRKLGFPTANVRMRHNRPPLGGIFAVRLHGVDADPRDGVASLGVRPTVKSRGEPTLEVYVLDFDGDIYGRQVRVEFLRKFRDEQKYVDLETLRRQIDVDVEQARAWFQDQAREGWVSTDARAAGTSAVPRGNS
jgi:riboflavin kinase/FMN adenylyltransferase